MGAFVDCIDDVLLLVTDHLDLVSRLMLGMTCQRLCTLVHRVAHRRLASAPYYVLDAGAILPSRLPVIASLIRDARLEQFKLLIPWKGLRVHLDILFYGFLIRRRWTLIDLFVSFRGRLWSGYPPGSFLFNGAGDITITLRLQPMPLEPLELNKEKLSRAVGLSNSTTIARRCRDAALDMYHVHMALMQVGSTQGRYICVALSSGYDFTDHEAWFELFQDRPTLLDIPEEDCLAEQ